MTPSGPTFFLNFWLVGICKRIGLDCRLTLLFFILWGFLFDRFYKAQFLFQVPTSLQSVKFSRRSPSARFVLCVD